MRQIKFRGKRIDNGEWIEGYYGESFREISSDIKTSYIVEMNRRPKGHDIQKNTLGQFTGLTDKNGKEVFEGDICNCNYGYTSDKIGVVYYEDGCFYVDDKHPSGNMPLKTLVKNEGNRIEVIGSIHDNPELLK